MFKNILKSISFGLITSNAFAAIEVKDIFPYVVPEEYMESVPLDDRNALSWSIGNHIYVMLVTVENNIARNLTVENLANLQISPDEAKYKAISNLETLAATGQIKQALFDGPKEKPFILFGGHWAAATAILLPSLNLMGSKATGSPEVLISIPHREALLLFANDSDEYVGLMREMILEKESRNPRPLTYELFRLNNGKLSAYK